MSNAPVLTNLTLSVLADSGWYTADFTQAEPMDWGTGQGCLFVHDYCVQFAVTNFPDFFCTAMTSTPSCTVDRSAYGICNLITYSTALATQYQYFPSNTKEGGDEPELDFCPVVGQTVDCRMASNTPPGIALQGDLYCPTCRCFESTLYISALPQGSNTLTCYDKQCWKNDTGDYVLSVFVGGIQVDCLSDLQQLSVPGYNGVLTCPDPAETCQYWDLVCSPYCVQNGGTCNGTACICSDPSNYGVDCSLVYTTSTTTMTMTTTTAATITTTTTTTTPTSSTTVLTSTATSPGQAIPTATPTPTPSSNPTPTPPDYLIPVIAGTVSGGVVLIVIIFGLVICLVCRRKDRDYAVAADHSPSKDIKATRRTGGNGTARTLVFTVTHGEDDPHVSHKMDPEFDMETL